MADRQPAQHVDRVSELDPDGLLNPASDEVVDPDEPGDLHKDHHTLSDDESEYEGGNMDTTESVIPAQAPTTLPTAVIPPVPDGTNNSGNSSGSSNSGINTNNRGSSGSFGSSGRFPPASSASCSNEGFSFKSPSIPPFKPLINSSNYLSRNVIPAEADVLPTENCRKINSAKLVKRKPATLGGIGSDPGPDNSECGSFYNSGDNRIARVCYHENLSTLSVSSLSINPQKWDCVACPKSHSVLSDGGGGAGGDRRLVIVLADQNFSGVLPTVSGNCLVILRLSNGLFDELGDLLTSIIPKGKGLPQGTVVLVGSLSQLWLGLSVFATAAVKIIRRFSGVFGKSVTTIPFIPLPLGGCTDPILVRSIIDGCLWLSNMPGYQLSSSMAVCSSIVQEEGGKDGNTVSHFNVNIHLPYQLDDYKGEILTCLGQHDAPAAVPLMSYVSEKKFVLALISELNSVLLTNLDCEPNFSRSAKRPAMYCALRSGSVEYALFIGGSNANKLSAAASTLGVDSVKIATGGWRLTKENVDKLLLEIDDALDMLPAGSPIVIFALDNSSYLCVSDDGAMSPICKSVPGDTGYHVVGELAVAPERSVNHALEQLSRIVSKCAAHPTFIISPLPRYISMPCCRNNTHITNFQDGDFFSTIFRDLTRLKHLIKTKLPTACLLDGMELICGDGYDLSKAEAAARSCWAFDPIHPSPHTYAKMALNLIEKIAPGSAEPPSVSSRGTFPSDTGPHNRKRSHSNTQEDDRSSARSRNWRNDQDGGYNHSPGRPKGSNRGSSWSNQGGDGWPNRGGFSYDRRGGRRSWSGSRH